MDNMLERIIASLVIAVFLCLMTVKLLGAMQQSGYKNGGFWRWLKRKDNLAFNRLSVLALCLALSACITALCFSFAGVKIALICSAVPYFALFCLYLFADRKYALKVPLKRTGRVNRLFAVYFLFVAVFSYAFIALLAFLSELNGSKIYALIAYVPFALTVICLPTLLALANACTGVFETSRNKKYVKRAGHVLSEKEIVRVAVVGSYGKTSVKNILSGILSEKYKVLATPHSYNTPMGVAKTVFSPDMQDAQVFIAEFGARKKGDIAELCEMVKPQFAVFTGVCKQHMQTFGSLENVFAEKSEILRCGATKVVCGEGLLDFGADNFDETAVFAKKQEIKNIEYLSTKTKFSFALGDQTVSVETSLLGACAVENIYAAALLAYEMGLSAEEIKCGVEKLQPIEHRLQLIEANGVYILDDGYNCNEKGAKEAIDALCRFENGKIIVTPGIVECGRLEEEINGKLGEEIANANLDKVILVGDTLVGAVKTGYVNAGGDVAKLKTVKTLDGAKTLLSQDLKVGDAVLFLNDLPDVY